MELLGNLVSINITQSFLPFMVSISLVLLIIFCPPSWHHSCTLVLFHVVCSNTRKCALLFPWRWPHCSFLLYSFLGSLHGSQVPYMHYRYWNITNVDYWLVQILMSAFYYTNWSHCSLPWWFCCRLCMLYWCILSLVLESGWKSGYFCMPSVTRWASEWVGELVNEWVS